MSIKNENPMYTQTVGALYACKNNVENPGEFDPEAYDTEVIKSEVVKNIQTSENNTTTIIKASGIDYDTVSDIPYIDMDVETIAFPKAFLAWAKGERVANNGLVFGGAPSVKPFFAFGKVVKRAKGEFCYEWWPKCQIIENIADVSTSEEIFKEQTEKVKIRAYIFNDKEEKKTCVDSEINKPEGLTEEKFFGKPILVENDLDTAITPAQNNNNQEGT